VSDAAAVVERDRADPMCSETGAEPPAYIDPLLIGGPAGAEPQVEHHVADEHRFEAPCLPPSTS
jgi:hypothetical protein